MVAAPIGARQRPAPIKRPPKPQQWTIAVVSLCVALNALTSYVMCSAGNAPRLSLSTLFMSAFNRLCIGSALSLTVAGVGCCAALLHDVTGPRTYSARTISNLALAALVLPGVAVAPLAAANRKNA